MNAIPFTTPLQAAEFVSDPSTWAPMASYTAFNTSLKAAPFESDPSTWAPMASYPSLQAAPFESEPSTWAPMAANHARVARKNLDEDLAPCANNPYPPLFRCKKCDSTQLIDNKCKC
jgi:hypothetical protein